jgi:hypothetical protein
MEVMGVEPTTSALQVVVSTRLSDPAALVCIVGAYFSTKRALSPTASATDCRRSALAWLYVLAVSGCRIQQAGEFLFGQGAAAFLRRRIKRRHAFQRVSVQITPALRPHAE